MLPSAVSTQVNGAQRARTLNAGQPQRSAAEISIVHHDPAAELGLGLFPLGRKRSWGLHQLVLHQPRRALAHPQPPTEFDRTDPALALSEVVDRQEPGGERQPSHASGVRCFADGSTALRSIAVEDRSSAQRNLPLASMALKHGALLERCIALVAAAGAALVLRLIQKIQLAAHYLFGFASTFPNRPDRSVWVDALAPTPAHGECACRHCPSAP